MRHRPGRPRIVPRLGLIAGVGLATLTLSSIGTSAAGTIASIETGVGAGRSASRIPMAVDAVSVSRSGPLGEVQIDALEQLGVRLAVPTARGRSFNIGLTSVRRGDQYVQEAAGPGGGRWQYPMSATALPVDAIGVVMSHQVSAAVGQGMAVLSATDAGLRGARVGDVLDFVAGDGNIISYVLGYVATDAEVGGAELVMSDTMADQLGASVATRMLLYGQFSRDVLDAALTDAGFVDGTTVRVSRSWFPRNPDSVLGYARTKQLLGEFDYRVNRDDSLSLDPDWVATNIVRRNFTTIGIRASCHQQIVDDIQAALDEVAAAGLGGAIDLGNTNTFGGCYNPRYSRVSGTIGAVSRHAWGMALDMNTVANAQGRVPRMDCRVVRIFRKHNFAWGGNFLVPDGMHFEWVGEPRNTYQYPSEYCPNVPSGGIESTGESGPGSVGPTERDVMFATDASLETTGPDEHHG